jgi:hypothetical protein
VVQIFETLERSTDGCSVTAYSHQTFAICIIDGQPFVLERVYLYSAGDDLPRMCHPGSVNHASIVITEIESALAVEISCKKTVEA